MIIGQKHGITRVEISHFTRLGEIKNLAPQLVEINDEIVSGVMNEADLKQKILYSVSIPRLVQALFVVPEIFVFRDSKTLKFVYWQGSTKHRFVGHSFSYKAKSDVLELLKRFAPPNCRIQLYFFSRKDKINKFVLEESLQKGPGRFQIPNAELCPAKYQTLIIPEIKHLSDKAMTKEEIDSIYVKAV